MDIPAAINPEATRQIVLASLLLIGAIIALFWAVGYYRKRFLLDDQPSGPQAWSLEDIRGMRDRGELTEEEYTALRASLIGSLHENGGAQASSGNRTSANRGVNKNFDLEKGHRG